MKSCKRIYLVTLFADRRRCMQNLMKQSDAQFLDGYLYCTAYEI